MSTANLRSLMTEDRKTIEVMDTISYVYMSVGGQDIRLRTTDVVKLQAILTEVMVMR